MMNVCAFRSLRFLGFFLVAILSTGYASAERITSIEFRGVKSLSQSRLMALTGSEVGEEYSAETIRNDIKSLSGVAREVEVRRVADSGGVKLVYVIVENPPIQDISVVGNTRISTDRLLATMPIKKGEVLASDAIARTRDKILDDYRAAGHTGAEVRIETLDNADGSVNVQVFINEGERIKVESVKIIGAKNISELRIRQHMESKGSWLFFKNFYDEAAFASDLDAVRQLYVSYGYFDAKVRRGEFEWFSGKKSVRPAIVIEEGNRYRIGDIEVKGATYFSPVEVREPFSKLKGQPYQVSDVARAIERVRSLYGNEGFVLTEVNEDYTFDTDAAKVNILIEIDERQRVHVGDVVIERSAPVVDDAEQGVFSRLYSRVSPPVKDETIKREVRLKSGDVYRKNMERQTVDRLERLGIFESVEARGEPTADDHVQNLVLEVEEGVTGNFILGAGYGDATGAYVFATYTERNLFGEARDLQVRGMVGTKSITGSINYLDSYFRPDGTSLDASLYKTGYRRRGYDEDEAGVSVEFGKPVDEYLTAYLKTRLAYVWLDEREDFGEDLDSYPVATVTLRGVNDTRDSKKWPTEGTVKSAGVEAGFADGALLKLSGGYQTYNKVRDNLIYALNVEGGFMPIPAEDVGITERLFMGGTEDLRGFAHRGAGPSSDEVPIGGSTKLLVQNELRYTILDNLGLGQKAIPLHGVTFVDLGMLGRDPLEIGTPRASVGTGIRVDMQQLNVGVDLALPLLKQDDDHTQFLHFKVSSAF